MRDLVKGLGVGEACEDKEFLVEVGGLGFVLYSVSALLDVWVVPGFYHF
jgi:hypothetical protein